MAAPNAITFAATTVGAWAPSKTVTLTNGGTAPLNIVTLTIAGAEFTASINSCTAGAVVAPGANCVVTVQFKPSAAGTRMATITITHNASPAVSTVTLTGIGTLSASAAPIAEFNSASLALPTTSLGAVSPGLSVALMNTGDAPLVLADLMASPSDFQISATNCLLGMSLNPAEHCTVIVTFAPSAMGAKAGTLTFSHNAKPTVSTIALTAKGAAVSASPPATRAMIEYVYTPLNYYFMTSRDSDKVTLDAIPDFQRTGEGFLVYASQQGSMRGVSRFYFDEVKDGHHSSHFYTLLDADLLLLADQNPARSTAPNMAQYEGVDSFAYAPLASGVGGRCASGYVPVYRVFRGNIKFPNNPNHRFTTSLSVYNNAVAAGWDGEGVNFCVPEL